MYGYKYGSNLSDIKLFTGDKCSASPYNCLLILYTYDQLHDLSTCPPAGGGGTAQKGGSYVRAHPPKRGDLGAGTTRTRGVLDLDFVKREGVGNRSCSKGGLGSLFIYYLYSYLSI